MNRTEILSQMHEQGHPISGGSGESYDDAIILYKSNASDWYAHADEVLKYIGSCRMHSWEMTDFKIKFDKGEDYYRVTIETRPLSEPESPVQTETYYFYISYYFNFYNLLINDDVHRNYKICEFLS